ncbi:hypothetical protein J2Z58_003226 [Halobacillus andaensis]|nr:hypothetical protein [Halobacillus andaensis]
MRHKAEYDSTDFIYGVGGSAFLTGLLYVLIYIV